MSWPSPNTLAFIGTVHQHRFQKLCLGWTKFLESFQIFVFSNSAKLSFNDFRKGDVTEDFLPTTRSRCCPGAELQGKEIHTVCILLASAKIYHVSKIRYWLILVVAFHTFVGVVALGGEEQRAVSDMKWALWIRIVTRHDTSHGRETSHEGWDMKEWSISAISCCQSWCPMLAQNVAVSHLRIRSASPEAGFLRQKRYCIDFFSVLEVLNRVCLKNSDHLNND